MDGKNGHCRLRFFREQCIVHKNSLVISYLVIVQLLFLFEDLLMVTEMHVNKWLVNMAGI